MTNIRYDSCLHYTWKLDIPQSKKYLESDGRWGEYASAWLEKDRKDRAAEEKDRWKRDRSKVDVLMQRILQT